jgi:hypothetical protein
VRRRGVVGLAIAAGAVALLLLAFALSHEQPSQEEEPPARPASERRIRVEVLNAAGIPGLARDATNRLRDNGFDVVYYGNARSQDPDTSYVFDRIGDPGPAWDVARTLGISRVATRPDPDLYLEVTVVLGRDWQSARAEGAATSGSEALQP